MNNDQLVKVAYMYYVDNISQKDIANKMNTSRANIARMLRLCREKNIVEIKINNESSYETFLALDLKNRFNLKDVTVIPDAINNEEAMIQVGKSGATIVNRLLGDGANIGISLGTTLYHFVSHMPTSYHQNVSVVQLVGGSQARPFKTDGINLVDTLATKLGAKAYLIHAPFLVKNEQLKEMLVAEPEVQETLQMMYKIDIAIIGIGSNHYEINALYEQGLLDKGDADNIISPKAVCTICGQQLNSEGAVIECSLNRRVIAFSVAALRSVKNVIALACGKDKVSAIKAALKGGFIDILVTDKKTALGILGTAP